VVASQEHPNVKLMKYIAAAIVLVVCTPTIVRADVVLQSFGGARANDADRLMQPFLDEMERRGFAALPASVDKRFAGQLPREASDPTLKTDDLARKYDYALAVWRKQPKLEVLLPPLREAAELTFANPGLLVADPTLREPFKKVLIALAIAYQRDGQTPMSDATEQELIRTYPDEVFTRRQAGVDGEQLYDDNRANLARLPRGTLTVTVSDPTLQVYVDEVIRRPGKAIADLIPGPYRIVVVDRNSRARRYDIMVLGGQDAVLKVDWQVDSAFVVKAGWVGFLFQTETDHANEGELARRFVSRATNDHSVAVVGIAGTAPRRIVATRYGVRSGHVVGKAQVELGSKDDAERARDLAKFIASGTGGSSVTVLDVFNPSADVPSEPPTVQTSTKPAVEPRPLAAIPPRDEGASRHGYALPATLLGLGAIAVGAGVYLSATVEPSATGHQPRHRWSAPGVGLQIGGGAALLAGEYLGYRAWKSKHPGRARRLAALVVAAGMATTLGGVVLWEMDEDDDGSQPTYRDTAPAGVGVVVGGAALVGLGGWLWSRDGEGSGVPIVSVGRAGGFIGWVRQF
jgi:hypothetical protein